MSDKDAEYIDLLRQHGPMAKRRALLERAAPHICSFLCPSVKRNGKDWTHVPLCREINEALDRAPDYDPRNDL